MCLTIGLATTFLSDHYGGPTILYALLLGMAFWVARLPQARAPLASACSAGMSPRRLGG